MQAGTTRPARHYWLATGAMLLWALALAGFGAVSPGYVQALHPVALLGAAGEPRALAFNLCAFLLPGLVLAYVALGLRRRADGAGWPARIGLQLVLLSALAFAAQGMLPIDPRDLDAPASRLHALAWTLWWIAFVPGALLATRAWAARRALGIALALLVPIAALLGPEFTTAPLAQRLACIAWFAWWIVACRRI